MRLRTGWMAVAGAVVMTLAVATRAEAGIACNVIAGFHHDHLFVPAHRGNEALAILRAIG